MATSGSFDYNVNRNDIINAALRRIGRLDPNTTPPNEDVDTCAEILNEMVKSWSNTFLGRQLWTTEKGFLFLQPNKVEYDIGPSGDHATRSYTEVAAQSTVSGSKVVLPNGAWAAGQYIGMINTDTEIQWTTISSVSNSVTAVLSDALSATVTTSGVVFVYTDKIERPINITNMVVAYHEGWDDEVSLISKERYNNIYDKDQSGDPTRYAFEPRITNARVYFDYQANDFHDVIKFDYQRPFEDFDAATDNPDFPQEWLRALKWNLASEIGIEFGTPKARQDAIDKRASALLIEIRSLYNASPRSSEPAYGRKARIR
jgi:hypothetical protein